MMCGPGVPTKMDGLSELGRLPWFRIEEGRVQLADPSLGPVIDFHTHLAQSYVLPNQVDLMKLHPETLHYLPKSNRLDLDHYANLDFTRGDLRRMKWDLTIRSLTAGGMRATHTAANLGREMADLGIRHAVLLPIDYPALSDNAGTWLRAVAGDPRFICYGSVHPAELHPEAELDRQRALGATGVKVHPNVQAIAPEDPRAMALYRLCDERKLIVFFHCGPVGIEARHGRLRTQVRRYERPIRELPHTTFVLGHSGALQNDEAIELARRYDNVYLELAGQPIECLRRMIERAPTDRMVFGTDWPWYPQALGLAKVFIATEGRDALRHQILYGNAARLLGLPPR
jgi:predicted TIM-barrel fold metal-dependent hydrolase